MHRQRGVALITAVLIVAIAAAVAAAVALGQQLWLRQMENIADRSATDLLCRGALHWASVGLLEDASRNDTDHLGEAWAQPLPILPVEGGALRGAVEDAQGRFNLNNLGRITGANPSPDLAIFSRLLELLGLDQALAAALADWIDQDGVRRPQGAEDIEYLTREPPYRAANQKLASVDELRLVRGFDAAAVEKLRPYVTVLPALTEINVNTAPPLVLAALVPGLDAMQAERIAEDRRKNPYSNVTVFQSKLPSGLAASTAALSVKSSYFLVTVDTVIGRHERRTEALLKREGKSTVVLWHRTQPIVNLDSSAQGGA